MHFIYSPHIANFHTSLSNMTIPYILYHTWVGGVTAHTGARIIIGDGVHTFIGINQEAPRERKRQPCQKITMVYITNAHGQHAQPSA